jgi:hypothetical protein
VGARKMGNHHALRVMALQFCRHFEPDFILKTLNGSLGSTLSRLVRRRGKPYFIRDSIVSTCFFLSPMIFRTMS